MKTRLIMLVLGIQTLFLLGIAGREQFRLGHGVVVHLETAPVDPRDPLRGDFVILDYSISSIRLELMGMDQTNHFKPGSPIYVTLEKKGEFHEVVRASLIPKESTATQPVLQGRVTYQFGPTGSDGRAHETIHVRYGMEQYYVREGTGNPRGKLTVDASVSSSGRGVIKQLYLNGVPYAEAMRDVSR